MIQALAGKTHEAANGRIESFPDEIMQVDMQPGRSERARRRHFDMLARVKDERAKHATDRLREAAGGILGCGTWIGKAAIPRRRAPDLMRSEAVDRISGKRSRDSDKDKDQ